MDVSYPVPLLEDILADVNPVTVFVCTDLLQNLPGITHFITCVHICILLLDFSVKFQRYSNVVRSSYLVNIIIPKFKPPSLACVAHFAM